jgi:hypothetical protein
MEQSISPKSELTVAKPEKPDVANTRKSLDILKLSLNKGVKNGAFDNVDDVYVIKVALNNVERALEYYYGLNDCGK